MSKPPVLAWATDAVYATGPTAGSSNKVYPSSGLVANGWEPGTKVTAENANALFNRAGLWTSWLDGLFDSSDKLTVPDLDVTDDAEVGGDLHVSGDLTVDGEIHYPPTIVPIGPYGWTPLDGDAGLFHPDTGFIVLDAGGNARARLEIAVGRRITRVTFRLDRTSGTCEGRLVEIDESGIATDIAPLSGTITNNSTAGLLTLDATYAVEVAANRYYALKVETSAGGLALIGARVYHEATP